MKKFLTVALVVALTVTLGYGFAFAGNGAPSGPHYNLNIIGVDNPKSAKNIGSERHTIFVPLYSPKKVHTNADGSTVDIYTQIFLKESPEGESFKVCDGNGFDEAYDCDGEVITNRDGAVFQLPANANWTCVNWDDVNDECLAWEADEVHYYVYARALGKPNGKATLTTCAYDENNDVVCSTDNEVFIRNKGKAGSKFKDVTRNLTSLCYYILDEDTGDIIGESCDSIFSEELYEYFWNYQNEGLRLLQLRFYTVEP